MAELKASFIPKAPIQKKVPRRRKPIGFLFIVTFSIFLITVAAAGGVYLYKLFLNGEEAALTESIERARQAIDPVLIDELQQFDFRLKIAERLLNNHVALSSLFELLEDLTLQTVRFESFRFSVEGAGNAGLLLSGEAKSFASVALQSDVFSRNPDIKNPIFSNLQPGDKGQVTFNFSADIDKELLLYTNYTDTFSEIPPPPVEEEIEPDEEENGILEE